jgi:hypothetical protein
VAGQAISLAGVVGLGGAVCAIGMTSSAISVIATGCMGYRRRLRGGEGTTSDPKCYSSDKKNDQKLLHHDLSPLEIEQVRLLHEVAHAYLLELLTAKQ